MTSTQELPQKVLSICQQLPVYVTSTDVLNNPELFILLENLCNLLHLNGSLKASYEKLKNIQASFRCVWQRYIFLLVLFNWCKDILYEVYYKKKSLQNQEASMVQIYEFFTLSQLKNNLILQNKNSNCKVDEIKIFGITSELLDAKVRKFSINKGAILLLNKKIEEKLNKEWQTIALFLHPDINCLVVSGSFAKNIAEDVIKKKYECENYKRKIRCYRMQADGLTEELYGLLIEYGKHLHNVVLKRRLTQYHAKYLEYSSVILESYFMKLKCLELEILSKIYTKHTVPALSSVSHHLDKELSDFHKEYSALQKKFSDFSGLDNTYQLLLEEYSKLCKDIEFCKITE